MWLRRTTALRGESRAKSTDIEKDYLAAPEYVPRPFTYLVDTITLEPHEPTLAFLSHCAREGKNLPQTISTKADHLYEWFRYLTLFSIDWEEATTRTLTDYRIMLGEQISLKNRAPLAEATIRGRVHTVAQFIAWRDNKCPPLSLSKTNNSRRRVATPVRLVSLQEQDDLLPRAFRREAQAIPIEDARAILRELGSDPLDGKDDRPSRDWLMSYFGLTTGARRAEILSVTWQQIQSLDETRADQTMSLRASKGKRRNQIGRAIYMPSALIERLKAYAKTERDAVLARAKSLGAIRNEPTALFLNGIDAPPNSIGRPYQQRRVNEAFAIAQISLGLTKAVQRICPETAELSEALIPKYTFHQTRHTYAIQAFHSYTELETDERWKRIQHQLGHKSVRTTMDIYGRSLGIETSQVRNLYVSVLRRVIS